MDATFFTRDRIVYGCGSALAVFILLATVVWSGAIQRDAERQANEILQLQGFGWARAEAHGRGVAIHGVAPSAAAGEAAIAAVAADWAIRRAWSEFTVAPPAAAPEPAPEAAPSPAPRPKDEAAPSPKPSPKSMSDADAGASSEPMAVVEAATPDAAGGNDAAEQVDDAAPAASEPTAAAAQRAADAAVAAVEAQAARPMEDTRPRMAAAPINGNGDDGSFRRIQASGPPIADAGVCQQALDGLMSETHIQFDSNSAELSPESHPPLEALGGVLLRCDAASVRISGHTDASGNAQKNLALSQARAEAVVTFLLIRGVPAERMTAKGYGSAEPIADNETEAGRALNRRIEFHVLGPGDKQ